MTTLADRGSGVRFEDSQTFIPAFTVPSSLVKDEEGAGDSYIGTMLGLLQAKPYEQWTQSDVLKAAKSASFAASLMVQSYEVRLGKEQARLVRQYHAMLR